MKQLTINRVRTLGKDMNAKGIVILAFGDDGESQAASYGRTKHDGGLLGKWLDCIYEAIESGEIADPFAEQQLEKRLTGPQSKLLFNDEGFEEHPEEKLDSAQLDEISSIGLHDLAIRVDGDGGGEDPPINAETTAEFVSRLKALPRSDVNTFLEQFKVQRVRDLRKSDVEAARQLLGGLEKRLTGPQSKLLFNDEGFEEHPGTDAAWLRGRR